jgi:nucleoside-triphosphatase THEP1
MAFDLSSISRGKRLRAPKVVIYGPPKIGKSTFAATSPDAVGILTEEGLDNIDVAAFPLAKTYEDVHSAITTLRNEKHEFQSVFLDSLDWLEPLILTKICRENGVDNIEKIGYGKGYVMADDLWRKTFEALDNLRNERNMTVICIAHEQINKVRNPTLSEDYDAYSLKLNKRAVAIISEWADIIGFCAHEVMTRQVDSGFNNKETKAITTGARKLHVNPHPAYVAGNRYGMADCNLNWPAFQANLAAAMSAPTK